MDEAGADPAALKRALGFIRRVNRLLRYNTATVRALEGMIERGGEGQTTRWGDQNAAPDEQQAVHSHKPSISHSRSHTPLLPHSPSCITLLDVATGSADLPQQIGRWARRRPGLSIRCVGLDLHPVTLAVAREWSPEVPLVRGDALRLPFPDRTFAGATVGFGVRNLADLDRGLAELRRVLRPGARLVVLEFTTPPNPIVRRLYQLYFHQVLPRVGRWVSGHPWAYSYLPASVGEFPGPSELAERMRRAGFGAARWTLLTGGIAALHVATV